MRLLLACLLAGYGVSAALAVAAEPAPEAKEGARAVLAVRTSAPQQRQWVRHVRATGNIAPWQEVIVSAQVAGLRIIDLRAQVGDAVKKGQVLAMLDREQVAQERLQAQAGAEEALARARRVRELADSGAISKQQIDAALAAEKTHEAQLALAELRFRRAEVVAPYDGVITSREAMPGLVADVGTPLFHMLRDNRLEWQAKVSAQDLPRLGKGMEATFRNAAGKSITGKVRQIAPTVDARTQEAIVYIDLPADVGVRAGEFVEGELVTATEPVLTIAQEAIIVRDGFSWVFTLEAGSHVRQRKVQTGQMRGNEVEILSGLDEKARVVTTGVGFLHDGDAVRIADQPVGPVQPAKKEGAASGKAQPAKKENAAANGKGKARP